MSKKEIEKYFKKMIPYKIKINWTKRFGQDSIIIISRGYFTTFVFDINAQTPELLDDYIGATISSFKGIR